MSHPSRPSRRRPLPHLPRLRPVRGAVAGPGARSCVVTGGGRGIGRAIAELLVARGDHVVLTDIDGELARQAAAEIGAAAGVAQDVGEEGSHGEVARLAASYAPVAAWFNNAGVGDDGSLSELASDAVDRLVRTNLLGTLWATRAALASFGPDGGDVVNVASLSGLGPVPGLSVYAATKAAVVSLSMSVNAETPRRVRVHALCPDGVATAMVDAMAPDGRAKALVASGGRMLEAAEVAAAAVDLLGSRRVVRTLPAWRGAVLRASALTPAASMRLEPWMRRQGRRALRRA